MFQRAHAKQRQVEPAVAHRTDREPAHASVGKRALTDGLAPRGLGAPDHYKHAVDTVRRELAAVRSVALPAYIQILRKQDLAPVAKRIQLANAAIQVRHLLMTAGQRVQALEKAMTHPDAMVLYLRREVATLASRAAKLGVYRGAEEMVPVAYEEPDKRCERLVVKRSPTSRVMPAAGDTPSTTATAAVTSAKPVQAPVAPAPRTRLARGTARYAAAPVQRKAVASARTADLGAGARSGKVPT